MPAHLPPRQPDSRGHALAAAAGGPAARDTRPGTDPRRISADGQIAGHPARIFAAITEAAA